MDKLQRNNNNVTHDANYFPLNTSAHQGNACKGKTMDLDKKFDLKFKLLMMEQ